MTNPRVRIPGQSAHLIRRCRRGQHLLTPCAATNAVMAYEIAHSSLHADVQVSGAMIMSNHYHIMVYDRHGSRSDFLQKLNRDITRRLKRRYDYEGSTWEAKQFTDVAVGACRELATLVYIWTNPVKDGLVEHPDDWPGFQIQPEDWGKERIIKKPDRHYGRSGPKQIKFTPQPPTGLRHLPLEEARAIAIEQRDARLKELATQRKRSKQRVKGRRAVLNTSHTFVPSSAPVSEGSCNRFSFECPKTEALVEQLYRDFLDDYETQRQRWVLGQDAEFPCGTLELRKQAPIRCKPRPKHFPGIYIPPEETTSPPISASPVANDDAPRSPDDLPRRAPDG